jgi:hypothetical protein
MKLADAFPDDLWGRKARRVARVDRAELRIDGTSLLERERAIKRAYRQNRKGRK